jgi:hypothetical protein
MNKKAARKELLWSAHEDWTGLWEAAWSMQTMWPELQGQPAIDAARSVLQDLLREGLVYLCWFDEETNQERAISVEEAYSLLTSPENWRPPVSSKGQIRFATTAAGDQVVLRPEPAT